MNAETLGRWGERRLIALIRREFPARSGDILLGIGDDAAVVGPLRTRIILTKDILVEDVDFRRGRHPAFFVGRKSLAVNLSDIAAMGGSAKFALLGLGLPEDLPVLWIREFLRGFRTAAREFGVGLVGGDLSKAGQIVISVTVIGQGASFVGRAGARPGDEIFVSGTLGDAALGFALLEGRAAFGRSGRMNSSIRAFLDPRPRLELGRVLARRRLATAMIDISDGLSVDLAHLCEESGVGAEIDLDGLPLSAAVRGRGPAASLDLALNGGEDFELLFAVRPGIGRAAALRTLARRFPLTRIGRMVEAPGVFGLDATGRRIPVPARGYEHFR